MSIFRARTRGRRRSSLLLNYVILISLVVFSLGPLTVLVFNSFKTTPQIKLNPMGPPKELRWQNYPEAWVKGHYSTAVRNTVFLVIVTVVGVWIVAGLAAYSLARLNPPGRDAITLYLLVGISLPVQATIFLTFIMWSKVGLTNNLWGLIPLYINGELSFSTFLLRSFMLMVPRDFDDAARVDGASHWHVFWRVIVPLTWPGFMTVGLLTALGVWNEFFLAVTFIRDPASKPVSTSLYSFIASARFQDWGMVNAASVMMMLPIIAIFLSLQRHFIEGMARGGLKG